jgi:hypothetical protein
MDPSAASMSKTNQVPKSFLIKERSKQSVRVGHHSGSSRCEWADDSEQVFPIVATEKRLVVARKAAD